MTTGETGPQEERLRVNETAGDADRDATAGIIGSVTAARAVQAAELQEMQLIARAITACARREQARRAAVFQVRSAEARRAEMDTALAAERSRVITGLADEHASELLRRFE